jgi:S-adenosylmethionine-dependent methyltransferase
MHESETVRKFYDEKVDMEWDRFNRHPIEFAMTKRILSRHLGPAPARILDVGGGPGRYSFWLAEQGYEVSLFDLSANNLAFAERKAGELGLSLEGYIHGNALELGSLVRGPFDHILLMGPLYHLAEARDRARAIEECLGLLAPGGCLFAAFLSSYAFILDTLKKRPGTVWADPSGYREYTDSAIDSPDPGFTTAFFQDPRTVESFMAPFGLEKLGYYTTEGLIGPFEQAIMRLDPEAFERCVELGMLYAEDEPCRATGEHLLYVGRKRGALL